MRKRDKKQRETEKEKRAGEQGRGGGRERLGRRWLKIHHFEEIPYPRSKVGSAILI